MEIPIILFCKKKNHHYFMEYCQSLSLPLILYHEDAYLQLKPSFLNLFLYQIPQKIISNLSYYQKEKVLIGLLNTEQLTIPEHLFYMTKLPPYIQLFDYSFANQKIAKYYHKEVKLLTYSYFEKELFPIPKTKGICMIYPGKSVRRHVILDQLRKKGIPVRVISGYGKKRDEELFQHQILLNIHFDKTYKIFEEIRCNRCIYNKMIVISETSLYDDENPLKGKYITVPYENIIAKVKDVLQNRMKYEEELFAKWDPKEKSQVNIETVKDAGSNSTE